GYVIARDVKGVPDVETCAFPDHMAPVCPAQQGQTQYTFQPFEHGFMLGHSGRGILAMSYLCAGVDSYRASEYFDNEPGSTLPRLTPPPGLQQPQNAFGRVWLANNVQQTLGWATAGETLYTTPIEYDYGPHPSAYIRLPQGQIIAIGGYSVSGYF